MPQNAPMKRQFTTIDGRTVMSNLPQHWGGNDWAITGVDNPLPVGNYVQTKSGVWIPQKGSDDGAADVRLTGNNVANVELIYEERNITVNAGTIKQVGSIFNVSQYNYVFVQLQMGAIGSCKVYERPAIGTFSGLTLTQRTLTERSNTSANTFSDYFPVVSLYTRFYIENTMQNDFTYGGLYIFGVRA